MDFLRLQNTQVRGTDTVFRSPGELQCLRPRDWAPVLRPASRGCVSRLESLLSSDTRASVTFYQFLKSRGDT